jgi:DNA-binding PadR family transcriptional regulator
MTKKLSRTEIRLAAVFLAGEFGVEEYRFAGQISRVGHINSARLIVIMDRWERERWIQGTWFDNGRRRRGYRLTGKGRDMLMQALA